MRNFRLLKADEIECRISQVNANGVSILLYKTARTDYSLLDEKFGMFRWQNDYKTIDGKMYCGIGIQDDGEERIPGRRKYSVLYGEVPIQTGGFLPSAPRYLPAAMPVPSPGADAV